MTSTRCTALFCALLGLALVLCAATPALAQGAKNRPFWEEHGSRQLDRLVTRSIAEEVCAKRGDACQGIKYSANPGDVAVLADSATHLAIREAIAANEPKERTAEFKITLLEASTKKISDERRWVSADSSSTRSEVRALADLKALLPYRDFALLDAATLSTKRNASTTLRVPRDAVLYRVELGLRPAANGDDQVGADFRMTVASSAAYGLAGGATVLSNSFSIEAGETVVVGSSKTGDDVAIVALVTFVE